MGTAAAAARNFEQVAARRALVDDFEKAELARTAVDALKPRFIIHRSRNFRFESLKQPSVKILDPDREYPILFNRVNMNRVHAAHGQNIGIATETKQPARDHPSERRGGDALTDSTVGHHANQSNRVRLRNAR